MPTMPCSCACFIFIVMSHAAFECICVFCRFFSSWIFIVLLFIPPICCKLQCKIHYNDDHRGYCSYKNTNFGGGGPSCGTPMNIIMTIPLKKKTAAVNNRRHLIHHVQWNVSSGFTSLFLCSWCLPPWYHKDHHSKSQPHHHRARGKEPPAGNLRIKGPHGVDHTSAYAFLIGQLSPSKRQ